ncbi:hypothetical protein GGR57DRAFT_203222 [Xylariaceae sp. FL1272]|nr:hypothetical protein GGR57DRAFT_203222 [Xylariaceae sp. FL1272]
MSAMPFLGLGLLRRLRWKICFQSPACPACCTSAVHLHRRLEVSRCFDQCSANTVSQPGHRWRVDTRLALLCNPARLRYRISTNPNHVLAQSASTPLATLNGFRLGLDITKHARSGHPITRKQRTGAFACFGFAISYLRLTGMESLQQRWPIDVCLETSLRSLVSLQLGTET